jgi:hypothetical protein
MKTFLFFSICIFVSGIMNAQSIDKSVIFKTAQGKINQSDRRLEVKTVEEVYNTNGNLILYKVEMEPKGYILIQTEYALEPVLAYSYTDDLDVKFLNLFKADAQERLDRLQDYKSLSDNPNPEKWADLINQEENRIFEQWPPEGTTSTGGWLETNWSQGAPYNAMCPFDNVANQRSLAGCPAIAAAMILHYNKKLNGTTFTDDDDYYHGYAGNNYYIDDDYSSFKFPTFDSLNVILDSIQQFYDDGKDLTNYEKAALVFACGTAATQVYNAQGSGTFGVDQAYDLYMKFGFDQALLYSDLSDEMYDTLIYNMKNALPSHLAVVDQAWQYGHNVVVDGYNTDGFFHINFGWGGSTNGWWNIPDDGFPYTMNVLEGIIVNINYEEPIVNVNDSELSMSMYPNPGNGTFRFSIPTGQQYVRAEVYSIDGKLIGVSQTNEGFIQIPSDKPGLYFIKVYTDQSVYTGTYVLLK